MIKIVKFEKKEYSQCKISVKKYATGKNNEEKIREEDRKEERGHTFIEVHGSVGSS